MRVISEIKKTEFIPKDNTNQYNSQKNKGNVSANNVETVEKIEITPIKNEGKKGSSTQKEQINYEESLRQYGIRDYDIARLQNGEITIEDLMKEIDKDPNRKRDVLESQGLLNCITNLEKAGYKINQKVYNLEELNNYIKKLESELNGYTNNLHNDEELNALAKIIKFLENGVDLDSALISGTVAYMYKDANGEKHYVYEQPIGSMMNDQINAGKHYIIGSDGRTYESLNYKEMYGESEYIKELRNNLTKDNSNFFEKTFLNQNDEVYKYDKSSDQSKYIESLKEIISNSQKESDELEAKIYELTEELETCKYVSTNVKEEVDYFMDNINPYVMQDDFLANKDFNNDSTKTVNDLIAKYNFSSSLSQKNYVSAPIIKISAQKEKVDIISCIINGKENISNGFLMTGNSAYMLDSSDDIISHYASWSKLMSDKEVEIFNYIYNTDTSANKDKAYQYLKDISKELDNRWLKNRTKEDEDFAGSHHTLASLGSVVVTPIEGISALCYSLKEYINEKLHPEDKTAQIYRTDVYSSGDVWRNKVARDIAETKGDLASFIYSTGMSMADSVSLIALSAATGGTATPVLSAGLMGSRAYVSTLNDSLDRGLSDGQAVLLAASSAVFETAMESYSVGHLMNLEGHVSKEAIEIGKDIAKDISNPQVANIVTKGFYVIANSVCQGVAEGEEELATEVLNYVSDIFVSKDSSQFCESIQYYLDNGYTEDEALYATLNNFKGQLTQAFAGGFASGLCFGGFSGINSTINTSYGISQDLYTNLQGDTKAQQFANALEINQQQLKELEAAAKKKGENLTQSEIELLQNGTIEQQAGKDLIKNIKESIKNNFTTTNKESLLNENDKTSYMSESIPVTVIDMFKRINRNSPGYALGGELDQFFSNLSSNNNSYGVNQGTFNNMYFYVTEDGTKYYSKEFESLLTKGKISFVNVTKVGTEKYMEMKEELINNYNFNNRDASRILAGLDAVGACSYASVASEIFSFYRNNPNAFQHDFGFPMYDILNGQQVLNSDRLLLDLYLNINSTNFGGNLFEITKNGSKVINFDYSNLNIFGEQALNSEDQKYLSDTSGKKQYLIDKYLKSKNPHLSINSSIIITNTGFGNSNNNYLSDNQIKKIANHVSEQIEKGNSISMGIYTKKGDKNAIRFIPIDGSSNYCTTQTWNEGSGHSVIVTGVNSEGFVVATWGGRYLIPYEDLQRKGRFILTNETISYVNPVYKYNSKIAETIFNAINATQAKHLDDPGYSSALIKEFLKTGNYNLFTNDNNNRVKLKQYSYNEIYNYFYGLNLALNNAVSANATKTGIYQGREAILHLINNKNYNTITSTNGARNDLMKYSIDEISAFVLNNMWNQLF